MIDLSHLSSRALLSAHESAIGELRRRGVIRSANNPVGDLAEFLFCRAYGWAMAPKSAKAADAICAGRKRYQIKARRSTAHNPSRQLGAMRDLDAGTFDYLAAVLFAEDYSVHRAIIVPHAEVLTRATFNAHTNSWKFILRDAMWGSPAVRDATFDLRAIEY